MKRIYPTQQPSLKNIAETTGLTKATVSRILAGKGQFATETKARVIHAAKALGYRPNRLVSGIQTGRTGIVGAILPIHVEWGARLLTGLQQALLLKEYVPIVLDCPSQIHELEMIFHLIDRRVEGIILFPADDTTSDEYFAEVHSRKIPLITVSRQLTNAHCNFVGCDDRRSGRLAAEHLLDLGHRVLGHLAGPQGMSTGRERTEGFMQAAMSCSGISVAQAVMPTFLPDEDLIEQFLENHSSVTGIFCANEVIALGLYKIAKKRGLKIPDRLSVVSHGDGYPAAMVRPSLTSTVENSELVGQEAAKMLLRMVSRKTSPKSLIEKRIPTRLIIRKSTGPAPN